MKVFKAKIGKEELVLGLVLANIEEGYKQLEEFGYHLFQYEWDRFIYHAIRGIIKTYGNNVDKAKVMKKITDSLIITNAEYDTIVNRIEELIEYAKKNDYEW